MFQRKPVAIVTAVVILCFITDASLVHPQVLAKGIRTFPPKKPRIAIFITGRPFMLCVIYSEHKATIKNRTTIMDIEAQPPATGRSSVGPQHIGEILPQVLARYGITTAPEKLSISSARLRRRMSGAARTRSTVWQRTRHSAAVAVAS